MKAIGSTTLTLSWCILGAVVLGLLVAVLAFRHIAGPRISATLGSATSRRRVGTLRGRCGEAVPVRFRVRMRRFSSRRGASEIEINVHFIADVLLHLARYGPTQALTGRDVQIGKGQTRSVTARGIKIDKWEPTPFEDLEVWVTVPLRSGRYLAWTTSFVHGGAGAIGVSRFVITVSHGQFRARRVSYLGTWRLRLLRWITSPNPYALPPYPSLSRATWD